MSRSQPKRDKDDQPIWNQKTYAYYNEVEKLAQEFPRVKRRAIYLALELGMELTDARAHRWVENFGRRIMRSFGARTGYLRSSTPGEERESPTERD